MSSDSSPVYLTAGRYAIWVASSLISTALGLVDGYLFPKYCEKYWITWIPIQACPIIPAFFYGCLAPRPTTPWHGFLTALHYPTILQLNIYVQRHLVSFLSKDWRPWEATSASIDVLFVFFLGLDIALLMDYLANGLLTQTIEIHWERARESLVPKGDVPLSRYRGSAACKFVRNWFIIRLLNYASLYNLLMATVSYIPTLLFAIPSGSDGGMSKTSEGNWSEFVYCVVISVSYPVVFAFAPLVWSCQVRLIFDQSDGQAP